MKSYLLNFIFIAILPSIILLAPRYSYADRLIFVINTTENDRGGPATAPYLDEARWMRKWNEVLEDNQKNGTRIRVIPIRANSNHEITQALEFWMKSTSSSEQPHEVLGLAIYSHGYQMVLLNESQKFSLRLPDDIESTFKPILGRFSPNSRVILTGCNVLWGQSPQTAFTSLRMMSNSFGLKNGVIYANSSKGIDPYTLFADPFNSEIKTPKRLAALGSYLLWPFSATIVPLMSKFVFNQGYALEVQGDKSKLIEVEQSKIFKANIDSKL